MKKSFNILLYTILLLLLIGSSFYSYFNLQNNWLFIFIFRIAFPLLITFAIFVSHNIYHTKENIINLLSGWTLIIPGGLISLFFVMGLKLPGFSILLPLLLSAVVVVLLDIIIRRVISKILLKTKQQSFFTKEIKDKLTFYGLLALMYSTTIVLLTVIF